MDNKRMRYEKGKGSDLKVIKDRGDVLRKKMVVSQELGNEATSTVSGKVVRDRGDIDKSAKMSNDKTDELKNKIAIDPATQTKIKCDVNGSKVNIPSIKKNNLDILPHKDASFGKINKNIKGLLKVRNRKHDTISTMTEDKQTVNNLTDVNRKKQDTSSVITKDTRKSNIFDTQHTKDVVAALITKEKQNLNILIANKKQDTSSAITKDTDIKIRNFLDTQNKKDDVIMTKVKQNVDHLTIANKKLDTSSAITKDIINSDILTNKNRKKDSSPVKIVKGAKDLSIVKNLNNNEESSSIRVVKDTKDLNTLINQKKKDMSFIKPIKDSKDTQFVSKIGRLTNKVRIENKSDDKSDSFKTDKESSSKENAGQKKSIVKPLLASDSSKTYKGVTFTDQKRSPTSLQINIPTHSIVVRKTKIPKLINAQLKVKPAKSVMSVKEKPVLNRKNRTDRRNKRLQNRSALSPLSVTKDGGSPQTEVAKWAPNSINKHTKPYYEAWVNTTLAAISQRSKFDKLFLEKQNIIQNFEMALERSDSPELVYENFADERYTGKIKVNHKSNKKVRH